LQKLIALLKDAQQQQQPAAAAAVQRLPGRHQPVAAAAAAAVDDGLLNGVDGGGTAGGGTAAGPAAAAYHVVHSVDSIQQFGAEKHSRDGETSKKDTGVVDNEWNGDWADPRHHHTDAKAGQQQQQGRLEEVVAQIIQKLVLHIRAPRTSATAGSEALTALQAANRQTLEATSQPHQLAAFMPLLQQLCQQNVVQQQQQQQAVVTSGCCPDTPAAPPAAEHDEQAAAEAALLSSLPAAEGARLTSEQPGAGEMCRSEGQQEGQPDLAAAASAVPVAQGLGAAAAAAPHAATAAVIERRASSPAATDPNIPLAGDGAVQPQLPAADIPAPLDHPVWVGIAGEAAGLGER
jgi:hypothetical protein